MGYSGRLIEMKHRRPSSPVIILPCQVGPPNRQWCRGQCSCIAARDCDASAGLANRCAVRLRARESKACLSMQGMLSSACIRIYSSAVSLGTRVNHPSLTSEIYRRCFGKGSLLQLANATVVLENGHGLSNTDHLLWG